MKQKYTFAGITVLAEYQHEYTKKLCAEYEGGGEVDFEISVTDADIEHERTEYSEKTQDFSDGYLESLALYRKFATRAADYGVLLFHGSAISFDGEAYIYTAPSGTGKSTHAHICRIVFGEDRVKYINDDKPLLRLQEGKWRVYGSPWDGKHRLSNKIDAPLSAICFLRRGEKPSIRRVGKEAVLGDLFSQVYRPTDENAMKKVLVLLQSLSKLPLWEAHCNISKESAQMTLENMKGERI